MSPTKEMGDSQDNTTKNQEGRAPAYIENQSPVFTPIVQRSRREGLLKKSQVVLRTIGFVFSFLSFVIMASNRHGITTDGVLDYSNNFNDYDAYRYLLAIGVISTVYTIFQVVRQSIELGTGKLMLSHQGLNLMDFIGDQIVAYLLISAASTAVPTTNNGRNSGVLLSSFTNSSAASISMGFMAFLAVALSALISGYRLSIQTSI
ncbi:hypothetical protein NE237_002711 [Protea cynaroides]|uniref:CASP-like protein n=1 Tax=Protea cynaroides TaxID=273540 RepID=A0A9Q0QRV9_9MAGN|nr:hypothetical protein NE237_002711 [Protea cynaroides]